MKDKDDYTLPLKWKPCEDRMIKMEYTRTRNKICIVVIDFKDLKQLLR